MSRHVVLCHVISRHFTSFHVISRHVTSCHVMSRHVTSCHVMSCNVTSCHVMYLLSRHVTSFHVMSRHLMSRHGTSCHVISRNVTSCHILPRHVTSCHVMSYHVTSYHVESGGTVTRPTLHCQLTSSTRNQFKLSMTVFVGCPECCRYNTASAVYDLVFFCFSSSRSRAMRSPCHNFSKISSNRNEILQTWSEVNVVVPNTFWVHSVEGCRSWGTSK